MCVTPRTRRHPLELSAINYFKAHTEATEQIVPFTDDSGSEFFHFATPLWVEASCLSCHGTAEDVTSEFMARYDAGFGYQVGNLRGILSIKLPAKKLKKQVLFHFQNSSIVNFFAILFDLSLLSLLLKLTFVDKLKRIENFATRIASMRSSRSIRVISL